MEIQLDIGENTYDPSEFVEAIVYAEDLGFRTAWLGDHFMPWYHSGSRSQFVWSTLGAVMARTDKIKVGPLITPPIGARYHPAIVAQASATLDSLFPGRLLLGVGTGEALNERPFWNGRWPEWSERMERLTEGIQLIRKLWDSDKPFSFEGKYFHSDFLFLYTKPKTKIPIYFAAEGRKAAFFAGKYGDKLITLCPRNNLQRLDEVILPAYRKGLKEGDGRRGGLIAYINFSMMSPAELKKKEWRSLGLHRKDAWSIGDPIAVEREGRKVTPDELKQGLHFVKNWKELIGVIEQYKVAGAEEVILMSGANTDTMKEFAENLIAVF